MEVQIPDLSLWVPIYLMIPIFLQGGPKWVKQYDLYIIVVCREKNKSVNPVEGYDTLQQDRWTLF